MMAKFPDDYRPNPLCMPSNAKRTFQMMFYYPNMCHVCHCLESATLKLKRCSGCNMISYCGKEHQSAHWFTHKEFCRAVGTLLKTNGTNTLFDFMKTIKDPVERLKRKGILITTLRKKMKRDIYDFENQMILYPRICEVCFETNPDLLLNCRCCPQASLCVEHVNTSQHNEICFYYLICYTTDFYTLCDDSCRIHPSMQYVLFQEDNFKMPGSMRMFLQEHVTRIPLIWMDLTKYDFWVYVCSEYYSKSLTLLHVLDQLNFTIQSQLTVHVIGLPRSKEYDFLSMETLLHLLTQLKTLNVVLVSSNLVERIEETCPQMNVCSKCVEKEKSFFLKGFKMPYSSYVNSKAFVSPDIVLSYDLGDAKCRLWDESLLKMKKISAPLVITNNTLTRALNYQKRMSDLFGYLTSNMRFQKNPFASSWPFRNGLDNELNLSNNYFTVYTLYNVERTDQTKKKKRSDQSDEELPDSVLEERHETKVKNLAEKNNETQGSSNSVNAPEKLDDGASILNLNECSQKSEDGNSDMKNSDSGKSKKKKKKKNKKKKTNQTSDLLKDELSKNDNNVPDISKQSLSTNNNTESEKSSVKDEDDDVSELTFQEERHETKVENLAEKNDEIQGSSNSVNAPEKLDDGASTSNLNECSQKSEDGNSDMKNSDSGKSKKKKTNQTSDLLKDELSNNDNDVPDISKESLSTNNSSESEKSSVKDEDDDVFELTFQLSVTSIKESDDFSLNTIEKKESKKKKSSSQSSTPEKSESQPVDERKSPNQSNITENTEKSEVQSVDERRSPIQVYPTVNTENSEIQSVDKTKSENQHSSNSVQEEKLENKSEEVKVGNKKSKKKKKKSKNKKTSPKENIESGDAIQEAGPSGRQENEPSNNEENEEQGPRYLFGAIPYEKTVEELIEENRNLFVAVEQLAEEYKLLKSSGKSAADLILQEIECLKMSIENIEDKVICMFPTEIESDSE